MDVFQIISSEARLIKRAQSIGVTPDIVKEFQTLILSYYEECGRDLPWRNSTNPYHILVSEVMLQQTQADRVKTKYHDFLGAFPDFETLAAAPLIDVLSMWQGMGYNRRAVALQRIAQIVVEEYGGTLPQDVETLVKLPGIGEATAAAIAVYAFNKPAVYIETNIRRIVIHFFFRDRTDVRDSEI